MSGNAALIAMQFIEITYEGIDLFLQNIVNSLRAKGAYLLSFVLISESLSFFLKRRLPLRFMSGKVT